MFDWLVLLLDDFRRSFRIADAVDILIMSVLLYSGLVWFKETASRAVVIGVSVVAGVYFVARAFDMYLISLVFHTAFAVVLIVLIVVFQEDLRRMFERVAAWGTLRELRPSAPPAMDVDSVVESAFHFASEGTGALMVIEGREPLDRHLDGGVSLNGELSKPLLCSIFDPGSSGHDGALILDKDRVRRFGVHLPLSKNHKEIRGRGTRHSAALGLSECSDALTIVVSEERGEVSVAENGKLRDMPTAAALKDRMERFLAENFPQKIESNWQRFVAKHAGLKVLAIVIAIMMWFVWAYNPSTVQRTFLVPIEYRDLPPTLVLDQHAPTEARLTMSGSERQFHFIEPGRFTISLDLSQADEGTMELSLSEKDLRPATNLVIDRIEPGVISLRVRRKENEQ